MCSIHRGGRDSKWKTFLMANYSINVTCFLTGLSAPLDCNDIRQTNSIVLLFQRTLLACTLFDWTRHYFHQFDYPFVITVMHGQI